MPCARGARGSGCGGEPDARGEQPARTAAAARAAARPPALCGQLRARILGRVEAAAATELSGLVLSRSQRGVLWTHNDSGDSPRLLAVGLDGRLLADVAVTGAEAFDWEDIAAEPRRALRRRHRRQRPAARLDRRLPRRRAARARRRAPGDARPPAASSCATPTGATTPRRCCATRSAARSSIVSKSFDAARRDLRRGQAGARHDDDDAARAAACGSGWGRRSRRATSRPTGARSSCARTRARSCGSARAAGRRVAAALERRPCTAGAELFGEGQGEALAVAAGRARVLHRARRNDARDPPLRAGLSKFGCLALAEQGTTRAEPAESWFGPYPPPPLTLGSCARLPTAGRGSFKGDDSSAARRNAGRPVETGARP